MKKASLAVVAFGVLALVGCDRGNQDQLNTVETNQADAEDLNMLSDDAANLAAEAQVLENQANQLEQEAQTDDATGAETPADENIAGM